MLQNTYLQIPNLIELHELDQILTLSDSATYEDGRLTASSVARDVKDNLQLNTQSQSYMAIQQIILNALNRNTLFRNAVLPQQVYPCLISKYQKGMKYGWHVDSPIMGNMLRTDVAMTIFLNNADEYEGGELELQSPTGTVQFKLNRGEAVCYPCTQVHRVNEVTGGERRVAVTWIQSIVKAPEQRKMLFDVYQVTEGLRAKNITGDEFSILQQHYSNLLRMWAY